MLKRNKRLITVMAAATVITGTLTTGAHAVTGDKVTPKASSSYATEWGKVDSVLLAEKLKSVAQDVVMGNTAKLDKQLAKLEAYKKEAVANGSIAGKQVDRVDLVINAIKNKDVETLKRSGGSPASTEYVISKAKTIPSVAKDLEELTIAARLAHDTNDVKSFTKQIDKLGSTINEAKKLGFTSDELRDANKAYAAVKVEAEALNKTVPSLHYEGPTNISAIVKTAKSNVADKSVLEKKLNDKIHAFNDMKSKKRYPNFRQFAEEFATAITEANKASVITNERANTLMEDLVKFSEAYNKHEYLLKNGAKILEKANAEQAKKQAEYMEKLALGVTKPSNKPSETVKPVAKPETKSNIADNSVLEKKLNDKIQAFNDMKSKKKYPNFRQFAEEFATAITEANKASVITNERANTLMEDLVKFSEAYNKHEYLLKNGAKILEKANAEQAKKQAEYMEKLALGVTKPSNKASDAVKPVNNEADIVKDADELLDMHNAGRASTILTENTKKIGNKVDKLHNVRVNEVKPAEVKNVSTVAKADKKVEIKKADKLVKTGSTTTTEGLMAIGAMVSAVGAFLMRRFTK